MSFDLKSALDSLYDNAKGKVANPFLGTFIIVWIVRNFRFCFAIFNFDKEQKLSDRLAFIQGEFPIKEIPQNIAITVSITFAVLIATYILLIGSRIITDGYEKMAMPWVVNFFDKKRVFTNEQFEALELANAELIIKIKEEKVAKRLAESERETAEKEVATLRESINSLPISVETNRPKVKNRKFQVLKSELNKNFKDKVIIEALSQFVIGVDQQETNRNDLYRQLRSSGFGTASTDGKVRINNDGLAFLDYLDEGESIEEKKNIDNVSREEGLRLLEQAEKENAPPIQTSSTFASALVSTSAEDDINDFYLKNKLTYPHMNAEALTKNGPMLDEFSRMFRSRSPYRLSHFNDKELKAVIKKQLEQFLN